MCWYVKNIQNELKIYVVAGQRLAIQEGVQILGTIAKNFTWTLSRPNEPIAEISDITLGPKEGLWIKLQTR